MEYIINGIQPAEVFHFFEEISAIPRPSGKEEPISAYLCRFAQEHGLEYVRDALYNVVIKKPGSAGCEQIPAVMLQGHQDMVCEKRRDVAHDFECEGISLVVDGDYLTADGTTLGADNGIAMAMMLAVLADDTLTHPPLECVFTVQEEIGLIGAAGLDASLLTARTMINLDSEEEGVATVSCAGGLRVDLSRQTAVESADSLYGCTIAVSGLKGGHSGTDIDTGRANANKLMGRILNRLWGELPFRIVSLTGGNKDNAIPRECTAVLAFERETDRAAAIVLLQKTMTALTEELHHTEPAFSCVCDSTALSGTALSLADTRDLVRLITLAPNGVQSRNAVQNFVISSLNLGILNVKDGRAAITFAPRSSVGTLQEEMKERLATLSETFGYHIAFSGEYPGWAYSEQSPIRDTCCAVWRELLGQELRVEAIHAGLECGLFQDKLPGLDAIAIGPTMEHVHTPDERLDMASCARVYQLLLRVLERLTAPC